MTPRWFFNLARSVHLGLLRLNARLTIHGWLRRRRWVEVRAASLEWAREDAWRKERGL